MRINLYCILSLARSNLAKPDLKAATEVDSHRDAGREFQYSIVWLVKNCSSLVKLVETGVCGGIFWCVLVMLLVFGTRYTSADFASHALEYCTWRKQSRRHESIFALFCSTRTNPVQHHHDHI